MTASKQLFDVAIVGAGAAGINAALVLGRARRPVLVCDDGAPRNNVAREMHGFISRDGESPATFLELGRAELRQYPSVALAQDGVEDLAIEHGRFTLTLASGEQQRARRILLATGMSDVLPEVEGLSELWGRSVFVCPYCDGWEVRDRRLAVYGNIRSGIELAQELYQWSRDIVVCGPAPESLTPDQRSWLEAAAVGVTASGLQRLIGDDGRLRKIELKDGERIERDALFLTTALRPHSTLAERLGCELLENAAIRVDGDSRTTVQGCYAAGDVVTHLHQVIIAASSGVRAAIALNTDLSLEDTSAMVRGVAHGP